MNAITKAVLVFLLSASVTFLYFHYLPGFTRFFRWREPLSTSESFKSAILCGLCGALIVLKKRN